MGTKRKTPTGKDYGRRLYLTDRPYMDQMQDTTNQASLEILAFKHSEFEKPYISDDYPDMQYRYSPPQPGPVPPGPVPPDPHPPHPPGPDPKPPIWIVFKCWFEGCFCPGETKCGTLTCTQDITGARASPGTATLTGGNNVKQMCINAPSTAKSLITVHVGMVHYEYSGGHATMRKSGSADIYVDECTGDECGCVCGGEVIDYTTQQMEISTSQTLSVKNAKAGCTYTWEVSSGGGTIGSAGTSVTYTAPSSNPDCAANATINLFCTNKAGVPQNAGSLSIAINSTTQKDELAAQFCEDRICPPCGTFSGACGACFKYIACDGRNYNRAIIGGNDGACDCMGYAFPNEMQSGWQDCAMKGMVSGITADIRTAGQKSAGCCPYQFL